MMNVRKVIIGVVLGIIGVPVLLVLILIGAVSLANRTNGTIVSSGRRRDYLLYVPRSYDRTHPTPLVISMHGAMNWPAFQMNVSQWNKAADEYGFIVVYPSGTGIGPKAWFMEGSQTPSRMPDVRFISELIDTLEAAYNIDPTAIYANGLSNGGGMAFVLSCTLSHRIAAIGAVSAAQSLPWTWCPDSTPVPMIAFHGTSDPIVPYNGGKVWIAPRPFPSVRAWVANWARRNRCGSTPVGSAVTPDVTRLEYTNCSDDATVVLYTVNGGGHAWPGGRPMPRWLVGRTTNSIDATSLMWAFFREHRLRPARQRSVLPRCQAAAVGPNRETGDSNGKAEDRGALHHLDGSSDCRDRFLVLQAPVLGTADGERGNRPGIRSLLLQVPETSVSKAEAVHGRRRSVDSRSRTE
jgi:polyhydroxybutyrate depolymerase